MQRLEAEPIWDAIFSAAGNLDLSLGGPSFDTGTGGGKAAAARWQALKPYPRAAHMVRGYSTSRDATPVFLQAFDVEDGRLPCPVRTQTVTAPQALFMMNSDVIDKAAARFADRLAKETAGDLQGAVDLAYRVAISRPPSPGERERALAYLGKDPARLKGLAWLLFNLDEFIYAP